MNWTAMLVVVGITGLFVQFYVYILPRWRDGRTKRQQDEKIIAEELNAAIELANDYEAFYFKELEVSSDSEPVSIGLGKVFKDAHVSKKLLRELTQVKEFAEKYNRWNNECQDVIRNEAARASKFYPVLEKAFRDVYGPIENIVEYQGNKIGKAIFRNELTFEIAKATVLAGNWDKQVIIKEQSGEERRRLFRDIIDGDDFHRFIERLQQSHGRESIKALSDAREKFLGKAQLIVKEVSQS